MNFSRIFQIKSKRIILPKIKTNQLLRNYKTDNQSNLLPSRKQAIKTL